MLKKIGIALLVLVLGFVVLVMTRPNSYTVSRSATIAAPAPVVFAQLVDFHRWEGWSPWEKLDPAMKKTFTGAPMGTGAIYSWVGNDQVGEGSMTIESVKPNEQVAIKLEFIKPFPSVAQTKIDVKPAGDASQVTWSMTGDLGFIEKAFTIFQDMDGMIAADFDKGLGSLKTVAEAEAKKAAAEEAAKKAAEEEAAKKAAAEEAAKKAAEEAATAAAGKAGKAKKK